MNHSFGNDFSSAPVNQSAIIAEARVSEDLFPRNPISNLKQITSVIEQSPKLEQSASPKKQVSRTQLEKSTGSVLQVSFGRDEELKSILASVELNEDPENPNKHTNQTPLK